MQIHDGLFLTCCSARKKKLLSIDEANADVFGLTQQLDDDVTTTVAPPGPLTRDGTEVTALQQQQQRGRSRDKQTKYIFLTENKARYLCSQFDDIATSSNASG